MSGARGFLLILLLLAASSSRAAMVDRSVEEVTQRAETVVLGEVTDQRSHWTDEGWIVTDVELRVTERWKGEAEIGETLTVRLLGGEVGDRGLWVEHEPRLHAGETTVLFLSERAGSLRVESAEQGCLRVVGGDALDHRQRSQPLSALRERVRSTLSPDRER